MLDFERNVNGNGKPVEQLSEVLDSILHKLNANAAPAPVLAPVAAMPTHSAWPVSVPVTSAPSQVSAQAPPSHTTGLTDSITSNSQAEEQAQLSAALVRERQLAAERTSELTASLQREQLKAAELQTQIEQQKLASARLALQAERERLQQAADATAAETERAERIRAERAREQESLRTEDAARRTQAARPTFTAADGDEDITVHGSRPSPAAPVLHSTSTLSATRAVSHTPAPTSTSHTQAVLPTTAPSTTTSSSSSSSDVVAEFEFIEGGRAEDTSVSHQQDAEDRRARDLRDKEPDLTSSAEAAQREVDADAYRLQHKQQRDEEDLRATEEARVAAAAEEKQAQVRRRLREQEEREEREEQQRLEKERLEKQEQEKEQARQQKEVDDAAALAQEAASVAVAKAEAEAAALAVEQATADAAAAATAQQAQKDEEEAERVQREKEEQRELSERAEKEAEEDAARETTEAAAQAAAEVEAVKAAEEQRRRDEQEVNEARARVLARRQKKKELDGQQPFLSASLPTSLQAAAAAASGGGHGGEGTFGVGHSADFSGINTTVSGSHNVSLMGGAVGGVSTATSLDSGTGFRSQPARNLFGNNPSFQSLQDVSVISFVHVDLFIFNTIFRIFFLLFVGPKQSDSSTDSGEKMEVGDVSDDHEGDRSVW